MSIYFEKFGKMASSELFWYDQIRTENFNVTVNENNYSFECWKWKTYFVLLKNEDDEIEVEGMAEVEIRDNEGNVIEDEHYIPSNLKDAELTVFVKWVSIDSIIAKQYAEYLWGRYEAWAEEENVEIPLKEYFKLYDEDQRDMFELCGQILGNDYKVEFYKSGGNYDFRDFDIQPEYEAFLKIVEKYKGGNSAPRKNNN